MGQAVGKTSSMKLPGLPGKRPEGEEEQGKLDEDLGKAVDVAIASCDAFEHLGRMSGGSCQVRKVREKATGKLWVVKMRPNATQCQNEMAAAQIYNRFGGKVPRTEVLQEPGLMPLLCQEFIEGSSLLELRQKGDTAAAEAAERKLCEGFAIDCLLANWDVVGGRGGDNIVIDAQGECWRIDNAGCFGIRAQGLPKGAGWCPEVSEVFLMRDVEGGNTQAAECLRHTTDIMAVSQIMVLASAGEDPFNHLAPDDKRMCLARVANMQQWAMAVSEPAAAAAAGVDELVAMGFDQEASISVLQACGGDTVEAICILSASGATQQSASVVDEEKIAALTGMGVDRERAISALQQASDGSVDRAIPLLFD